jgi:hypothetical protein
MEGERKERNEDRKQERNKKKKDYVLLGYKLCTNSNRHLFQGNSLPSSSMVDEPRETRILNINAVKTSISHKDSLLFLVSFLIIQKM